MLWLWLACGILALAVICLCVKLCVMKKGIREICEDFEHCLQGDTNVLIRVSSADRTVRTLAGAINRQLSQLRHIRRKYEHGDQELKDAVTNLSHDLRTPLTAICGYLELMEKQPLSPDAERYLEQLRSRTQTLRELTEELFRYSVALCVPSPPPERVDLRRVLEESLLSFEGALMQASIVPEVRTPQEPVWRWLDASALSRVFENIIHNAVKYSDGDLSVTMDETGKIDFSNRSQELNTVEVGKLFDRFFTVDSARRSTGLGLSIAKALAERMNGELSARYAEGKLTVTAKFPAEFPTEYQITNEVRPDA